MARVTYHGETFDVPDSNGVLLDYYRGENATVEVGEVAEQARFPRLFDGQEYVDAPVVETALQELADDAGDAAAASDALGDSVEGLGVPQNDEDGTSEPVEGSGDPQPGPAPDPAA